MTATQSGYSGDILTVNPTAGQFVNIAALNGKIVFLALQFSFYHHHW